MKKKIWLFIFALVCCGIYYTKSYKRDIYNGYSYNISPQVEFINKVLSQYYNNKYKLYTAQFNEDDDVPNIREYNPNAILWLGKKKFKWTKDLVANLKKYGIILCSTYNKCEVLEILNTNNVYQFPVFLINKQIINKKPKEYALLGNPIYASKELKKRNLTYKKYT